MMDSKQQLIVDLYSALDTAILLKIDNGLFELLSHPPSWLQQFVPRASSVGCQLGLEHHFLFLDNFLVDAQSHWENAIKGHISSGPWLERDSYGQEWPLEAKAVSHTGSHFLLLQYLGLSYEKDVKALQQARDNLLDKELLEKEVYKQTIKIKKREEEIAIRLLAATGIRDEETGAHVRRIGLYSEQMALAIGWDQQQSDDIRVAAPMHDIGKIGIPDNILLKPGKLSEVEFKIMQHHTNIGAQMLDGSDIPILQMAKDIAQSHHEKWNGCGYPHGLQQDVIPMSARIVAIVDTYDALIHKRIYKLPVPEKQALTYIKEHQGTQFDPQIVAAFMDLLPHMREIREKVREEDYQISAENYFDLR